MRLTVTGLEHGHRGLVGVQHPVSQQLRLERIDQRLQPGHARTHPLRQGRPRNGQASLAEDVFLAVQRLVIGVLGHQHLGQQSSGWNPLVDDVSGYRCLCEGLAVCTCPLAADMTLYCKDSRPAERARLVRPVARG